MDNQQRKEQNNLDKDFGSAFKMDEESNLRISSFWGEFKKLDYRYLIPINKIFDINLFRKKAVQWILVFGLLPLIYIWVANVLQLTFEEIVWLVEIYFCLFWALYFYSIINPPKTMWKQGLGYAFFTAAIGIPILLSVQTLPLIRNLYADTNSNNFAENLIGFLFGVGILEETCKALPLIIFGLRKGTIKNTTEGMFLGFLSGLGFAASEGVTYTLRAAANVLQNGGAINQVMTFLHRAMSGPLQHSTWAGVTGWFIGTAAQREKKWPIIVVGILCMALLHGLYDSLSDGFGGIVVAAIGYITFMGYLTHREPK
jgi:protease PrsW